jgi:hypothetical protein
LVGDRDILGMNMPRLTSLDIDGWKIDDAEVAHAASPETYWIPDLEVRESLQPCGFAKIRFYIRVVGESGEIEECGERMWVKVLGRLGDWYQGELDNQPSCTDDIKPGMEVWFQPRHVIDVDSPM